MNASQCNVPWMDRDSLCLWECDSKQPYPPLITATNPPDVITSLCIPPHSLSPIHQCQPPPPCSSAGPNPWTDPRLLLCSAAKTMEVFTFDASSDENSPLGRCMKKQVSGVSGKGESNLNRLKPQLLFKALTLNAAWMRGDTWYESYKIWFWMFKHLWKYPQAIRIMGVQKEGNRHVSIAISVLDDWLPNAFSSIW